MCYFSNNYHNKESPINSDVGLGLRNAQIGTIHKIIAHFTVSKKPGIIIMPTLF
jgi:hypothetical protein